MTKIFGRIHDPEGDSFLFGNPVNGISKITQGLSFRFQTWARDRLRKWAPSPDHGPGPTPGGLVMPQCKEHNLTAC